MNAFKFINVRVGDPNLTCHIDAVHAQGPNADAYTGQIVEQTMKAIGVAGIIATVARGKMDLNRPPDESNRPAILEYREAIRQILESKHLISEGKDGLSKRYLHLAVHGMRDDRPTDFEIGTRYGNSCDQSIAIWFYDELASSFPNAKIGMNQIFPGDKSKEFHRQGDPHSDYRGYGENFNTIQLEISRELRKKSQKQLVEFLAKALVSFDRHFNATADCRGKNAPQKLPRVYFDNY